MDGVASSGGATEAVAWKLALLAAGGGLTVAALAAAFGGRLPAWERRLFHAVNRLPNRLRSILWPAMQIGSLGGGVAVAVATGVWKRDWRVAVAMLAAVMLAWYGAKLVKRIARRGRPADFFVDLELRERAEGLGFVSGHTAVAFALATAAYPVLGPAGEIVAFATAALVGVARVYFGAHLPLDVVGGAGLGIAIGVACGLALALTTGA
jgi:undecaprenyl-diphosphatase